MPPDRRERIFVEVGLEGLPAVVSTLLEAAQDRRIWLLHGDMGAGKTTLVREFCHQLEVADRVSSPTFSLVNEYRTQGGGRVCHFDFYRIKNEAEAFDIGTEEYLDSGDYCFVEWPEKIPSLLEGKRAEVSIRTTGDTQRTIAFFVA
jgi:tRNA threonylcarbamoyladenosine biosynthesis protein TsaE